VVEVKTYSATAERDGKFWLIHVPEVDRFTQARNLQEVEAMARDLILVMTGANPAEVDVLVELRVPESARRHLRESQEQRARAAEANRAAAVAHRAAARALAEAGLTVRDIGVVLAVSHQRAAQLLQREAPAGAAAARPKGPKARARKATSASRSVKAVPARGGGRVVTPSGSGKFRPVSPAAAAKASSPGRSRGKRA